MKVIMLLLDDPFLMYFDLVIYDQVYITLVSDIFMTIIYVFLLSLFLALFFVVLNSLLKDLFGECLDHLIIVFSILLQ
jgi:hypothetical protein